MQWWYELPEIYLYQLQCCGGDTGTSDWDNNIYFNCSSEIVLNGMKFTPAESCGVPFSCCKISSDEVPDNVIDTHCGYGIRKNSASVS